MIEDALKIIEKLIELLQLRHRRSKSDFNEIFEPLFRELLVVHADYVTAFAEVEAILSHRFASSKEEKKFEACRLLLIKSESRGGEILDFSKRRVQALERLRKDHQNEMRVVLTPNQRRNALMEVKKFLAVYEQQLRKARQFLKIKRLQHDPIRQKLLAMVAIKNHFKNKVETRFINSIIDYFSDRISSYDDHNRHRTHYIRFLARLDEEICIVVKSLDNFYEDSADLGRMRGVIVPELRENWAIVCETYAALQMSVRS